MGARRLRPMTAADLDVLPLPGGTCAFAETGTVDHDGVEDPPRAARRREWAREVDEEWGACGVVAVHDEQVIGFVTLAPAQSARRVPAFAAVPLGADVAVLLSAQVVEAWQGKGIGRQLVTSAAGLVARREIRAFEAVGTRLKTPSCLMPVGWLQAVGFGVVREHPVTPRLRMDLQTTQRWTGLGAAWNRLTGLVVPPAAPQPASYARRDAYPVPPQPAVQSG